MSAKESYFKALYDAAAKSKNSINSICYKIGALTFIGQHQQARLLFQDYEPKLSIEDSYIANFHMGLSYTRTADHKLGWKYFLRNKQQQLKQPTNHLAAFYTFQGLSFYNFYFSRHQKSYDFAEKAYSHLLKMTDPPPLLLAYSLDIQAYNLVFLGQIHLGLNKFKEAIDVAIKNKFENLKTEFEIAYNIYKCTFGENIEENTRRLKSLYEQIHPSNDYSKANILILIAKLLILQGKYQIAQDYLKQNFITVYGTDNKTKVIELNTLMSHLLYLSGRGFEALSALDIAKQNLDEESNITLLLPMLGLETKILQSLNIDSSRPEKKIIDLSSQTDRYLNKRISRRNHNINATFNLGEDFIGDLIDRTKNFPTTEVLSEIINKNLHGLIPEFYQLKPGQKCIIIPEIKDTLIYTDDTGVQVNTTKTTHILLKILLLLNKQQASKELLIKEIWGYEYDPLRHDALVYTTMGRLRKMLKRKSHWLHTDDNVYFLANGVSVIDQLQLNVAQESTAPSQSTSVTNNIKLDMAGLNYRQIETLKNTQNYISVAEYTKKWQITRMTSLRDLKDLCDRGYFYSQGRARATRYYKSDQR